MSHMLCGRLSGIHLNEHGGHQAKLVGQTLKSRYRLTAIVSSPLERALETAMAIQQATGIPVDTDQDLLELDYGVWTGMPFDQIRNLEAWQHYNQSRSNSAPPGGELLIAVQLRACAAINRVLEQCKGGQDSTIAVVTHGDVIRSLLVLFLGMPIDYIHRITVSPCSLSEVNFEHRYATVIRINQEFYE